MNFALVFQIDMGHQLLMQIEDIEGLPARRVITYTTAFLGSQITVPVVYGSEEQVDQVYDEADQEFALRVFLELKDEYFQSRG